jgi:uncharacterized membrane protein HdeD (DUF308 family)
MYWITGLLGLVLGIAPFVLGYSDHTSALWTSVILGAIVFLVSLYEAFGDHGSASWEYWTAGFAGLLAIIAPWIFGFSALTTALWTTVIVGAVLLILAAYELFYDLPQQQNV